MERPLIIPFFLPHAGCPFTCVFCNQWQISGQTEEAHLGEIEAKVHDYLDTYFKKKKRLPQQVEVAFFGGSFTGLPARVQVEWLCNAARVKEKGLINGIRLSTRPDYINDVTLKRLFSYGVTTIELGIQSLVDEVLEKSRRGYTYAEVIKATRAIRAYPFSLVYQLMIGLPGDNREYARLTVIRTVQAHPDFVRIYPAVILKGTTLEGWYRQGLYTPWTLFQAVETGAEWLGIFSLYGIPVIRMGLQSSENLTSQQELVAGPYDPAYGELVESRLMFLQITSLLNKAFPVSDKMDSRDLTIRFNPRDHSKVTGQRKTNLQQLKRVWNLDNVVLLPDAGLAENDLVIEIGCERLFLSRQEFLEKYRIEDEGRQEGKDENSVPEETGDTWL